MKVSNHPDINELLKTTLTKFQVTLNGNIAGVYLYGSLVHGDFTPTVSDIDIYVVTNENITEQEFKALDITHQEIVEQYPAWKDRLEVLYIAKLALLPADQAKTQTAIISPGDPFHLEETDYAWIIINSYLARKKNICLMGPDLKELIPEISGQKFIQEVKNKVLSWKKDVVNTKDSIDYQLYVVLTLCRALYVVENGESVSKKKAAIWALNYLPEWQPLIQLALDNYSKKIDVTAIDQERNYAQVCDFVERLSQILWSK